jgi:hypothetical protein
VKISVFRFSDIAAALEKQKKKVIAQYTKSPTSGVEKVRAPWSPARFI